MSPSASHRRLLPPVLLLGLLVLALLPSRWSFYGPPLHGAVKTILSPLSLRFIRLSSAVRQQFDRPILAGGDLERLSDELRYKDALIIAAQRRIADLEILTAELQGLRQRLGDSYVFRRVDVVGRSTDPFSGTFQIAQGAMDRLAVGIPAVDGANLIGRIVQVTPTTASIEPITAAGTLVQVLLAPSSLPLSGLPAERARPVQIVSDGRRFRADDVDRTIPVQVGDYARLDDTGGPAGWPLSVQGYIVGQVISAEPNPDDPLRQRIVIRPLLSPTSAGAVTLILPRSIVGQEDAR
jgi:cell shape-determining protein MreC